MKLNEVTTWITYYHPNEHLPFGIFENWSFSKNIPKITCSINGRLLVKG